jgi:hypothetical protein
MDSARDTPNSITYDPGSRLYTLSVYYAFMNAESAPAAAAAWRVVTPSSSLPPQLQMASDHQRGQ